MVRVCAAILIFLVSVSLLAPILAPEPPASLDLDVRLHPPSRSHLLGTDELGRDILSRLLYGGRISFLVSIAVVSLSLLIGLLLGLICGYRGGWIDEVFMRLADIVLAFPDILMAIGIIAVLGPGIQNVVFALVLIGWVSYARLVRGLVLKFREFEFVTASRSVGASGGRLIFRHILPNVIPPIIVQTSFGLAAAMLAESSLSFLGLGVQPPQPSWGNMLSDGKNHLLDAPYLTIFPGLAIFLAVLAFHLLGDALRDQLDPHLR